MLSLPEEILLLLLEDEGGRFVHVPELSMRCVLSGAVLMELALADRIDTDPERLFVVDAKPIGDELLDPALRKITASTESHDAGYWVSQCARMSEDTKRIALKRLVDHGILDQVEDKFLWVFRSRRYPLIDGSAEREVKLRIMDILLSDQIPGPRDVVIVGLVDACGLFKHLLSEREHKRSRDRIRQVRRMDLIGRVVNDAVREIEASLAMALHPPF